MSPVRVGTAAVALAIAALAGPFGTAGSADTAVTTANGTWTAYPGQQAIFVTSVQQPINADGSSNFRSTKNAVVPVKFSLAQGTGAFRFESIFSDTNPDNNYSYLNWSSSTPFTFAQLAQLSAVYSFVDGDCAGGSLRWTVRLDDAGTSRNLNIHYQPGAGGIGQQTCAAGTSGANLIGSVDTIYVTQAFNGGHSFPSPYNNTYAAALGELGSLPVLGATLIIDSGWGANGDQVVNLSSATVGVTGSSTYTETFTPQPASPATPTCALPTAAAIKVTKTTGADPGDVVEPVSVQPKDSNSVFRVVDCKLMYNLATSSLSGPGLYKVSAVIGGVVADGAAVFELA